MILYVILKNNSWFLPSFILLTKIYRFLDEGTKCTFNLSLFHFFQFILRKRNLIMQKLLFRGEEAEEEEREMTRWEPRWNKSICEKPFIVSWVIKWDFLLLLKTSQVKRIIFSSDPSELGFDVHDFIFQSQFMYLLHIPLWQLYHVTNFNYFLILVKVERVVSSLFLCVVPSNHEASCKLSKRLH